MAGGKRKRREYTDDDRAAVFLALTVHEGNVARSSRETGVPEQTVRDWKAQWERDGLPPELRPLVEQQAADEASDIDRVRSRALRLLEDKLPDMSGRDLAWTFGVLTDKSMRLKGLSTQTVEHKHSLPTPEEAKALVAAFAEGIREAAVERDQIIEAEVIEQPMPALPRGSDS